MSLITDGGRPAQTFDQVIHARLVDAYAMLDRANHTDPEALTKLDELESLIAEAANQPCSSTVCTPGLDDRTTRQPAAVAHAGWRWLCEH